MFSVQQFRGGEATPTRQTRLSGKRFTRLVDITRRYKTGDRDEQSTKAVKGDKEESDEGTYYDNEGGWENITKERVNGSTVCQMVGARIAIFSPVPSLFPQ